MIRDTLFPGKDIFEGVLGNEHYSNNWGSDDEIFQELIPGENPRVIFEIGSWEGKSAIHMAKIVEEMGIRCEIVCIDPFCGSAEHWTIQKWRNVLDIGPNGMPRMYERFLSNVVGAGMQHRITPLPVPSFTAANILRVIGARADLTYIDGDHEYEAVLSDYRKFWPLTDGVMFGHDSHCPGVARMILEESIKERRRNFWIRRR